jgi:hypothetical protein
MFNKQGVYMLNIRHDDNCRFWQRDNFDGCNCNPDYEYTAGARRQYGRGC